MTYNEGVPTYCETQAELPFGTYNYYILHSHVALVDAGITVPKKSDLILVLHADWDDAVKFPDGPRWAPKCLNNDQRRI